MITHSQQKQTIFMQDYGAAHKSQWTVKYPDVQRKQYTVFVVLNTVVKSTNILGIM